MIQAVIFDFDGVIVDSEPLHWKAFVKILSPMGYTLDYTTYLRDYVGYDDRDFFKEFFAHVGRVIDDQRLADLIDHKAQAFVNVVNAGFSTIPGAVDLIKSASRHWPLAISSGALLRDIELILPAIGDGSLKQYFKTIVTADQVARSKPDPQTYTLAVERLGLEAQYCIAIEDTSAGLSAAIDAGLRTIGVTTTYEVTNLSQADQVVGSLEEVTVDTLRQWFD